MKKQKALLHIGGSDLQVPGLRWAKELGLNVFLTDVSPNVPGRQLADRFDCVDGTDIDALIKLARRITDDFELAGAYTSNDFGIPAVAAIAEEFSLPGPSTKSVSLSLDKAAAKNAWDKTNLPVPIGVVISDYEQLLSASRHIGLPLIIKPVNSSGSRGVSSVWEGDALENAYRNAKQYSPAVLVEQLVEGHHFDVNAMFVDDKFVPCGTMDRVFSALPYHYPIWGCEPSSLGPDNERMAYDLVEKAARQVGITIGPVKADLIWTERGPVLLELAARFHGDVSTSFVTHFLHNRSPIKAWFASLAGQDFNQYLPNRALVPYAGWMGLFPSDNQFLKGGQSAVRDAMNIAGVKDIFLNNRAHDKAHRTTSHKDNTTLCGFVWATGASKEELYETLQQACGRLGV